MLGQCIGHVDETGTLEALGSLLTAVTVTTKHCSREVLTLQ